MVNRAGLIPIKVQNLDSRLLAATVSKCLTSITAVNVITGVELAEGDGNIEGRNTSGASKEACQETI